MAIMNLEHARGSLARGFARQAMVEAARNSADTAAILNALHGLAPNLRSRQRFAARLESRPGVVRASVVADGLVVVVRTVITVDLQKDGQACFTEDRIAWTRFRVQSGNRSVSFAMDAVHVTRHVLQRRIERSDCPLADVLGDMDAAMLRALRRMSTAGSLSDGQDDYLTARRGVWAGGLEEARPDPGWGPAFCDAPAIPVFSVRTFLGEDEMRPTVWLGWSEAQVALSGTCAGRSSAAA